jgi:hypothetical protein
MMMMPLSSSSSSSKTMDPGQKQQTTKVASLRARITYFRTCKTGGPYSVLVEFGIASMQFGVCLTYLILFRKIYMNVAENCLVGTQKSSFATSHDYCGNSTVMDT